ncbi:MAG: hypothetical protein IT529_16870 [Burkholderiales bacterium]|nr:hypothetical protein [Burkholderiales bacterium]
MSQRQVARVPAFAKALALAATILGSTQLAGCVVYEPYPGYYYGGSNYERAWSAAVGGVQDAGIRVTSSDAASGLIRGSAEGGDVVVTVARQPDGSVRVQFDAQGPAQRELADRFSRAYDRRMGR